MDDNRTSTMVKILVAKIYNKVSWPIILTTGVLAAYATDQCLGSLMNLWIFGDKDGAKSKD